MDHAVRAAPEQLLAKIRILAGEPRFVMNWYQVVSIERR